MMATSLNQAVHRNLECPVCLSFFKDPRILNCSHTFCKGCLNCNVDVLLCPTCRGETSVPGGDVGRLQPNITVRSLVEDVETQVQVCSNCNPEDKSLQGKWSKCKIHPNYDEECFCLNCNKYVCCKCAILEHVNYAHTILEAGAYEIEQKNNIDELASKADAKVRDVDKYVSSVVDQRKKVHNVQKQRKDEIDETFEEFVQILKKRKTVLKHEVEHGQLGKLDTSLGDMEESSRKQIDQIKKALDLVKNGLNFPLQTEALTSYNAKCQQLEELLSRIGPDEELPRRTAEEGEKIRFRSQGPDELQLGQLRQEKSKWVLRAEDWIPLRVGNRRSGMVISPNNEMAVGYLKGGIVIYSSEGIIQDTVLKSVQVRALHFMPDGGYVIRDTNNRISLHTRLCEKVDVKFKTKDVAGGDGGGLTVANDGRIFIGYTKCREIQVFTPAGGKAMREIKCNGYEPTRMFAMTSSQAIVVQSGRDEVHVINNVSGAIIHSICKSWGRSVCPAVCQDDSVIIAWVEPWQGLLSIIRFTNELRPIKRILTDFEMKPQVLFTPRPSYLENSKFFLQAFKTGEIVFCDHERICFFHEIWE